MLYYCGRIDLQVKLNGYRIELGDIESNLTKIDFIDKAVAVDIPKNGKVSFIAAFVVLNQCVADSAFETASKIKKKLANLLPNYMLPKKIIILDKIPTTDNGKIDRKKLRSELI